MEIDIPTMLQSEDHLLFTPRAKKDEPHLPAQIVEVKGRQILVKNSSVMVVGVQKNTHYGDLFTLSPNRLIKGNPQPIPHPESKHTYHLKDIIMDPDNILSEEWRTHFKTVLSDFTDTVSPIPGLYNGYYGHVDCSLNLIQQPPASNKARLPSYSQEKKKWQILWTKWDSVVC